MWCIFKVPPLNTCLGTYQTDISLHIEKPIYAHAHKYINVNYVSSMFSNIFLVLTHDVVSNELWDYYVGYTYEYSV